MQSSSLMRTARCAEPALLGTRRLSSSSASSRRVQAAASSSGSKGDRPKAAFFDFDGTLVKSNIVMPYVLYKLKSLTIPEMIVFIPTMLLKALLYIVIDKFDRSLMNVLFYTNYRGLSAEIKEDMAKTLLTSYFRPNLFPSAVLKLRELKSQGYRLVVVSGSLDFLVEPLAKELGFDDIMCATLEESNGHCTGRLMGGPVSDLGKAKRLQAYAEMYKCNLADCIAFGDSIADVPMMLSCGDAVCVNPSSALKKVAANKGWAEVTWKKGL